jgi:hypothetical protein
MSNQSRCNLPSAFNIRHAQVRAAYSDAFDAFTVTGRQESEVIGKSKIVFCDITIC